MRKALLVAALAAAPLLAAAPAQAAPPVPSLPDPTDCHEVQDFFGIKNVMDCEGPAER